MVGSCEFYWFHNAWVNEDLYGIIDISIRVLLIRTEWRTLCMNFGQLLRSLRYI